MERTIPWASTLPYNIKHVPYKMTPKYHREYPLIVTSRQRGDAIPLSTEPIDIDSVRGAPVLGVVQRSASEAIGRPTIA